MLIVIDGKPEQIHAASRTRLSGAIIDALMLQSLSGSFMGQQTEGARH